MDLSKGKFIRRYPKDKFKTVGEFIRSIGGYGPYNKWLKDNPVVSKEKIGRNDKCPCQSGKKYKKCCINK